MILERRRPTESMHPELTCSTFQPQCVIVPWLERSQTFQLGLPHITVPVINRSFVAFLFPPRLSYTIMALTIGIDVK
jgi:hypothetical protein